ncbi:MAG: hypothetical protein FWD49_04235 [Firmicutes bacterium]|nr:hypothetical protein [Bacillota bacterium]
MFKTTKLLIAILIISLLVATSSLGIFALGEEDFEDGASEEEIREFYENFDWDFRLDGNEFRWNTAHPLHEISQHLGYKLKIESDSYSEIREISRFFPLTLNLVLSQYMPNGHYKISIGTAWHDFYSQEIEVIHSEGGAVPFDNSKPENLRIEDNILLWDATENAKEYIVYVALRTYMNPPPVIAEVRVSETFLAIADLYKYFVPQNQYLFAVSAVRESDIGEIISPRAVIFEPYFFVPTNDDSSEDDNERERERELLSRMQRERERERERKEEIS